MNDAERIIWRVYRYIARNAPVRSRDQIAHDLDLQRVHVQVALVILTAEGTIKRNRHSQYVIRRWHKGWWKLRLK